MLGLPHKRLADSLCGRQLLEPDPVRRASFSVEHGMMHGLVSGAYARPVSNLTRSEIRTAASRSGAIDAVDDFVHANGEAMKRVPKLYERLGDIDRALGDLHEVLDPPERRLEKSIHRIEADFRAKVRGVDLEI